MQIYEIKFVSDLHRSVVFSTNKTDRHDKTEIFCESGVKHHNPNPAWNCHNGAWLMILTIFSFIFRHT